MLRVDGYDAKRGVFKPYRAAFVCHAESLLVVHNPIMACREGECVLIGKFWYKIHEVYHQPEKLVTVYIVKRTAEHPTFWA